MKSVQPMCIYFLKLLSFFLPPNSQVLRTKPHNKQKQKQKRQEKKARYPCLQKILICEGILRYNIIELRRRGQAGKKN